MNLEHALKKIGVTVVKAKGSGTSATHYLRVSIDKGALWSTLISEFLLNAVDKEYQLDISKYFYVNQGEVLYLWRVVITGDVETARVHWARIAIQVVMANTPEVTQIPLVGRISYPFDPLRGKLKGSHDVDEAAALVSMAANAGGPVVSS